MQLQQIIFEDMKQAMKAKDAVTLGAIRLLRSAIKNVEIDHGVQNDVQVQKIVTKIIKQWKDAIEDYKKGGRADLVKEAEATIKVLSKYLPKQITEDEVREVVKQVLAESGQTIVGPAIGMVMKKVMGKTDGNLVAKLVKEELDKS